MSPCKPPPPTQRHTLSLHDALPICAGGRDTWALELAGRAEAAWGLQESMAWADVGGEVFVISQLDRKSTRLNSSHSQSSYAVFCLKKKNATGSRWPCT